MRRRLRVCDVSSKREERARLPWRGQDQQDQLHLHVDRPSTRIDRLTPDLISLGRSPEVLLR